MPDAKRAFGHDSAVTQTGIHFSHFALPTSHFPMAYCLDLNRCWRSRLIVDGSGAGMTIFDRASSITRPSAISQIDTAGNSLKNTRNIRQNSAIEAAVSEISVSVGV